MTVKRILTMAVALGLMAGLAVGAQALVTEKVEAMIAENTPLKVNDNDLWLMVGGPLVFGIQYDKYATANLALGLGVGPTSRGCPWTSRQSIIS